jgi:hypothetical protein
MIGCAQRDQCSTKPSDAPTRSTHGVQNAPSRILHVVCAQRARQPGVKLAGSRVRHLRRAKRADAREIRPARCVRDLTNGRCSKLIDRSFAVKELVAVPHIPQMWRAVDGYRFAAALDSDSDADAPDLSALEAPVVHTRLQHQGADPWVDAASAAARLVRDAARPAYEGSDSDTAESEEEGDADGEGGPEGGGDGDAAERLLSTSHEIDLLRRSGVDMTSAAMRAAVDELDLLTLRSMARGDKLLLRGDGQGDTATGAASSGAPMRGARRGGGDALPNVGDALADDDLTAAEVAAAVQRMRVSGGWSAAVEEGKRSGGVAGTADDASPDGVRDDVDDGAAGVAESKEGDGSGRSFARVRWADEGGRGGTVGHGAAPSVAAPAATSGRKQRQTARSASSGSDDDEVMRNGGTGDAPGADGGSGCPDSDDEAAASGPGGRDAGQELYDAAADDDDERWVASRARDSSRTSASAPYAAAALSYTHVPPTAAPGERLRAAPGQLSTSSQSTAPAARAGEGVLPVASGALSPPPAPRGSIRISCAGCFAVLSLAALPLMRSTRGRPAGGGGGGADDGGADVCAYLASDASGLTTAGGSTRSGGRSTAAAPPMDVALSPTVARGLAKRYGCAASDVATGKPLHCAECGVSVGALVRLPGAGDSATGAPGLAAAVAVHVVTDNAVPG